MHLSRRTCRHSRLRNCVRGAWLWRGGAMRVDGGGRGERALADVRWGGWGVVKLHKTRCGCCRYIVDRLDRVSATRGSRQKLRVGVAWGQRRCIGRSWRGHTHLETEMGARLVALCPGSRGVHNAERAMNVVPEQYLDRSLKVRWSRSRGHQASGRVRFNRPRSRSRRWARRRDACGDCSSCIDR